jgi:hypothetical protein
VASFALVVFLMPAPACFSGSAPPSPRQEGWRVLEPGLELGSFALPQKSPIGDSTVQIVRVDPDKFDLRLLNASAEKGKERRTARAWAAQTGLVAAINASMYQQDHVTSTALMRTSRHVNSPRLTDDKSVLAFERLDADAPRVKLLDRECDDLKTWQPRYGTLVQSIRMISCQGANVWTQQPKRWSTAAIGTDKEGRVLLIHVRSPYTVHDLIDNLRHLPLSIDRAMYVEGGPEAQLYVRSGREEHEFFGSYETDFYESDGNDHAWPVPNVIGVVRRTAAGAAGERAAGEGAAGEGLASQGATARPPAGTAEAAQARIGADLAAGRPVVAHVVVALCDNENQGIVPVPAALGNGQAPSSNLYWVAMYGVRSFLARRAGWSEWAAATKPTAPVLERVVLRTTIERAGRPGEVFVVAEAWDGREMRAALQRFLTHAAGGLPATLDAVAPDGRTLTLPTGGAAHLVAFVGHNGLMDFSLDATPGPEAGSSPRSSIVLACASKPYFLDALRTGGSFPLLLTTGLMAPEAYTLDAVVRAWFGGRSPGQVREAAAHAYDAYQACGLSAARGLFFAPVGSEGEP